MWLKSKNSVRNVTKIKRRFTNFSAKDLLPSLTIHGEDPNAVLKIETRDCQRQLQIPKRLNDN